MEKPARVSVPVASWWALTVLLLLYIFSYLDRYVMTMLVTDIQGSLHLSDSQIGFILGPAFAICYAVFSVPFGWATDRYPKRWVIFCGTMVFSLATMAAGLASSFETMLAARVAVAIGEASLGASALALIADKFPRERISTAVSIYSTGPKIGGAAAYGIAGITLIAMSAVAAAVPALRHLEPWRLTFMAVGLPSVLIAGLLFTFGERPTLKESTSSGAIADAGVWGFLRDNRGLFAPLLIGFSAMSVCGNSLIAWLPTFSHRTFGWSPAVYGPILSVISFAGALTLVVKGLAMDWFLKRGVRDIHVRFYSWLLIGTLPLALGAFLLHDGFWFFAVYSVVGVVAIPWIAYASVVMQVVTPPYLRGRVWGLVSIPLMVMGGLGPALVGVLTDKVFGSQAMIGWSLTVLMWTCIPLALVCMRLSLPALRRAVEANETGLHAASAPSF